MVNELYEVDFSNFNLDMGIYNKIDEFCIRETKEHVKDATILPQLVIKKQLLRPVKNLEEDMSLSMNI